MKHWFLNGIRIKPNVCIGLVVLLSLGSGTVMAMSAGQRTIAQGQQAEPSPTPTTEPSPGDEPGPTTEPSPGAEPSPTPTTEPSPGAEPSPTPTTEPSPGAEPSPTPTTEPSPTPTTEPGPSSGATRIEPIAFVSTAGDTATASTIPGYKPRLNRIVGSGALLVNADNQVTGYYFTTTGLEPSQTLPYHFHAAKSGATPTSCEGDKNLFAGEAPGAVITDLSAIAPLQSTANGVGRVGSSLQPVQLSAPVPLSDIGYLNIHSTQGSPGPGIVCANVRLNPGGFARSR